ncbi:MAG TPA: hypothetical protein V6C52_01030 [Coleofasciculaceae cyanobacterium]
MALSSKPDEEPAAPASPAVGVGRPSFELWDRASNDPAAPVVGALMPAVGLVAVVGAVGFADVAPAVGEVGFAASVPTVGEVGFAAAVLVGGFGAAPDGMVGTDGLVAIKPCLSLNIYISINLWE